MKKIVLSIIIFGLSLSYAFSIVPFYHGARSLGLGYAGSAFNYDVNSIFVNPSLLASFQYSLTGYQYQNNYRDYKDFSENLQSVLDFDLSDFQSLGADRKETVLAGLEDVFTSKSGIHGFAASVPGYAGKGYGLSYSVVKTGVINPVNPANSAGTSLFDKDAGDVTNQDIADLEMNFIGLKYKQLALAYSFKLSRTMRVGAVVRYLKGDVTEFNMSVTDSIFSPGKDSKDYLEVAWENPDTSFSRITADVSVGMDVGRYFKVALISKNVGSPKIETPVREITLKRRVIAALALRPNNKWGIYLDVDIAQTDLLFNGNEIQPISFGVERSFFKNRFFVRGGFRSDLTEKHFFGSSANTLYGLGMGFNMRKFIVDIGVGLDGSGSIKSLAVSGFIMLK
ncbi:MAG: conjugal transfer protein TraF [bacterium]|nr:conjugal transfer protein TraF [bacterium]